MESRFFIADLPFIDSNSSELLTLIRGIEGASSIWSRDYLLGLMDTVDCICTILENSSDILALAILHTVPMMNPLMVPEPHIFLRRLVVKPEVRSRGIGTKLIAEVQATVRDTAKFEGIEKVGWQTNVKSMAGNFFFKKHGFFPIGSVSVQNVSDYIYSFPREYFVGVDYAAA